MRRWSGRRLADGWSVRVVQRVVELVVPDSTPRHGTGQRMRRRIFWLRLEDGPRRDWMVFWCRADVVGSLVRNDGRVDLWQVSQQRKVTVGGTTGTGVADVSDSTGASTAATRACEWRR